MEKDPYYTVWYHYVYHTKYGKEKENKSIV